MRKVCNVAVGTIWSHPDKARELDYPALKNSVNIQRWLLDLTQETKLAFSDQLSIETQILYGEPVEVIEEHEGWAKVLCLHQSTAQNAVGYPGYIPSIQLTDVHPDSLCYARVNVPKCYAFKDGNPLMILSFNTTLPVVDSGEVVRVNSPHGVLEVRRKDVQLQPDVFSQLYPHYQTLFDHALQYIDLGYLWGGMSSYGYDCSGYMYQLFRSIGYQLPRDADDQYQAGVHVDKEELRRGDLAFFSNQGTIDTISHVGLYIGNGYMIHSPNTPAAIEIMTINSGRYADIYVAGSRVVHFESQS